MGEKTGIGWTDHTFNPWWGCVKISPGCANCYAATWDRRTGGGNWGVMAPRKFFGDKHWAEPLKWDRAAAKAGVRRRVFCASMADVFEDRRDLDAPRARLWALIAATPHLDWLLLTKRPENLATMLPWRPDDILGEGWGSPWRNVWLGTTMEDMEDERVARVDTLVQTPAALRFLSLEPLLEGVLLDRWLWMGGPSSAGPFTDGMGRRRGGGGAGGQMITSLPTGDIGWVIAGCETAAPDKRRPARADWFRSLRDECAAAGVPFFLKQAREERQQPEAMLHGIRHFEAGGASLDGSTLKQDGTIEAPWLDRRQHLEFPASPADGARMDIALR